MIRQYLSWFSVDPDCFLDQFDYVIGGRDIVMMIDSVIKNYQR